MATKPKKPKAASGHYVIEIHAARGGRAVRLWSPNGRIRFSTEVFSSVHGADDAAEFLWAHLTTLRCTLVGGKDGSCVRSTM